MMEHVFFHDLADGEVVDAVLFYNEKGASLGVGFLDELERSLEHIRRFPEAFPLVYKIVRKKVMRRFPYNIMYAVLPNHIWVLAVANQKRRPFYWLDRLKN